ncbi:RDD family protein [Acinetobacter qingfengensis]|uniref:RDD family protein n=1 Tax=Acinetobacter qingfengensis TaxID=1262585 RepID=A0A1E7RDK9_9GAMM|nr:RDD family protein [Acinetobacter qingfengensis]KAA8735313.1 RDD family protein [Acinetobacter qingfengensis]OEY97431.1 RDD family protein [Acinetobacter qingfengensis]
MQIYLARNNQQAGPYTVEQLNQMLASQQVVLTDLIWHEGMTEWKPLGEMTQGQYHYSPSGYQQTEAPINTPFHSTVKTDNVTTDNAQTKSELAPISKRAFAKFIDLLLWFPIFMFPSAFMNAEQTNQFATLQNKFMQLINQNQLEQANILSQQMMHVIPNTVWIAMAIYVLVMLAIQAVILQKSGQSIGKKVLAIQIVDQESNQLVSVNRSFFLRSILFIILNYIFTPFFSLIDWLFAFGRKRQALHDKLTKTIVIHKK